MEDLSLHILDIAENSIAAEASLVEIYLIEDRAADILELKISDNGRGMDPQLVEAVKSPFVTSRMTRRVGLGLPMLAQSAENAGGSFSIDSRPGEGTVVHTTFKLSHIDRIPIGDLETTLMTLIVGNDQIDFIFNYRKDREKFMLDTRDLRRHFKGEPFYKPKVLKSLRELIKNGIREVAKENAMARAGAKQEGEIDV